MTKRFFIWLFWYFLIGFLMISFGPWMDSDGTMRIPAWFSGGALLVLVAWWGGYLIKKYPSKRKLIFIVAGVIAFLMVLGAIAG